MKKGWCNWLKELTKIIISPSNKNFIFKENKYLVGKSDENKVLVLPVIKKKIKNDIIVLNKKYTTQHLM